jgi:3-oxoacyl-[acyl-carrier-protein] synthase-3
MKLKFQNKRISGILSIVPAREVVFEEEIENYNFSRGQSMKLKRIMGYNKRRIVEHETCISDLCTYGLEYLFEKNLLEKEEIDALVLVTQSPDYFMPPTSHIIHGRLGLKKDMICLDINQGCSGYIVGLSQAFMLLENASIHKVVLLTADTLSKKVSKHDRNNNPQIGDGASVTIIERQADSSFIYGELRVDGKGADVLKIPAGGFKIPASEKTAELKEDTSGNLRALDHLVMKGDEVFNFVQREIPPMVEELLAASGMKKEDIESFIFHQPNKFMLKKLADKMGIPYEKMPNNVVENFGNSSAVTIPVVFSLNFKDKLLKDCMTVCVAGFGVGLNWGAFIMEIGKLDFCEMIDYQVP